MAYRKEANAMFKARMKFVKEGRAKYLSHLDLMHTLQRAMARCELPVWFTEGFHQHSYVSVALPLSTGYSSECEFLDFVLTSETMSLDASDAMLQSMNRVLPEGLRALAIYPLGESDYKVGRIAWAKYRITWSFDGGIPDGFCAAVQELFARPSVEIVKKSKRGQATVNMRELMRDFTLSVSEPDATGESDTVTVVVTTAAGNHNLSPAYLTQAVQQYLPQYPIPVCAYHRLAVFVDDGSPFH